ncbi:MAG: hypothetical protein QM796_05475 [Chthoniobacteraceae bacterium]
MLQRLATRPALHQFPQRFQILLPEWTIKFQIQVHPFLLQHLGEQVLDIQPRAFHPVFLKKRHRGIDHFKNCFTPGHARTLESPRATFQPKA